MDHLVDKKTDGETTATKEKRTKQSSVSNYLAQISHDFDDRLKIFYYDARENVLPEDIKALLKVELAEQLDTQRDDWRTKVSPFQI